MPENVGVVGGEASCFTVMLFDAVPPALVALHVSAMAPSLVTGVGPQPFGSTTGEPLSARFQVTLTGLVYPPWAPAADAGTTAGEMDGGEVPRARCISASARAKSHARSPSGPPAGAAHPAACAGAARRAP